MNEFTLIIPYYRNPNMLRMQLETIANYSDRIKVIVVDDGSPEPAEDVIAPSENLELYRIDVDIPWNRGGARNLGAHMAQTDWIVHVDIDHLLPADCAAELLNKSLDPRCWYRFPRYRLGKADETRRKDAIPDDQEFGQIKPHMDSYLCTRQLYWKAGGYDEDYSGCLGGGTPFTKMLERTGTLMHLPEDIHLHVVTRSVVDDSSDNTLSRDTSEYSRRKRMKGIVRGRKPMRFKWHRVS